MTREQKIENVAQRHDMVSAALAVALDRRLEALCSANAEVIRIRADIARIEQQMVERYDELFAKMVL